MALIQTAEVDRHHSGNTLFHHGDTIDGIDTGHGRFVVRYDNKLGIHGKFTNGIVEFLDVGIIQWCVYLIQNTEWGQFV